MLVDKIKRKESPTPLVISMTYHKLGGIKRMILTTRVRVLCRATELRAAGHFSRDGRSFPSSLLAHSRLWTAPDYRLDAERLPLSVMLTSTFRMVNETGGGQPAGCISLIVSVRPAPEPWDADGRMAFGAN